MRGTNVIILTALVLATVGIILFAPGARWVAVLPALGALFFAWRAFSTPAVRQEDARTRTTRRENRLR